MRRVAIIACALALVLAAAGCGGGGGAKQSHTVLEVSKAFSDAGFPFTAEVTSNPYVSGQSVYLPGALNGSAVAGDVQAQLSATETASHAGAVVWVFDTDAHAAAAVKQLPLAKWGTGSPRITRVRVGNVIFVGSNFVGAQKTKLDQALAALGG